MTTGLTKSSSYYLELITAFPPRPITNEVELIATRNRINSILDQSSLTEDDRNYLKVLGILVYDYEKKHEIIPSITGIELLQALLEESNLNHKDLICIFENESIVLDVLQEKRQLTREEKQQLGDFFKISASLF